MRLAICRAFGIAERCFQKSGDGIDPGRAGRAKFIALGCFGGFHRLFRLNLPAGVEAQ